MESPVPNGACGVKRTFFLTVLYRSQFSLLFRCCVFAVLIVALTACDGSGSNSFSEALEQSVNTEQQVLPGVSINRPPQFTLGPDLHAVSTTGLVEIKDWIKSVTDGDGGRQHLQFETVSISHPDLFAVAPWVSYPSLTLRFEPVPGVEGIASVGIRVKDDGGTENGGEDTSPIQSFLIHIKTPDSYLNHAPSFQVGPDISVTGSGQPFSMRGWAKNSDDGDGGHQRLEFDIISNSRTDLFLVQPWVSYPSHTLRFTPKSCLPGTAKLGVILKDNGGTLYGGADQSEVQYFTITIQCPDPNNSPVFEVGPDILVPASIGDAEFPQWAKRVSDGDNELQKLRFDIVSNDNAGLFSRQPEVSYPSRTLRFTPVSSAEGTAKLRIRLQDDGGTANGGSDTSTTQTFYITITQPDVPSENTPPSALPIQTTTAFETAIDIVLQGIDPDNDALVYETIDTPAQGTVQILDNVAHYRPDPGYSGLDTFTYKVNDGEFSSTPALVEINVSQRKNTAPVAESIERTLSQGGSIHFELQGVDAEDDSLDYYILNQPGSGYLTGELPYLEYTASKTFSGKLNFNYQVNDGFLDSQVATVNLFVNPINQAPSARALFYSTGEDESVNGLLDGADDDSKVLSYHIETPPQQGTLSGPFPEFIYSPNADFNGSDSFSYKVFDGEHYSDVAEVSLTIYPVNDTPIAFSQTVSTPEETPLDIKLRGEDVDLDSLSYSLVEQPESGAISVDRNQVVYTPTDGFFGNDSFSFRVSDGLAYSEPAVVTILVNNSNDRPYADAQSHAISEDTTLDIHLTGSDPEGSSLNYQIVSQPPNGTLDGVAPDIRYRPDAQFNGIDTFSFLTNDGELDSELALVTIEVTAENDAPVAEAQTLSLDENTSIKTVLTGQDPDGDSLNIHILSEPTHGTLDGEQNRWVYTPSKNFSGDDHFTFAVSDGYALSPPAPVAISVRPINTAPVADSASYQMSLNEQLILVLQATDEDSDELNYTISQLPQHGSLEGQAPDLVYVPNEGYVGLDALHFSVNDGTTDSHPARVSIEILSEANRAPIADAGSKRFGRVNSSVELNGSGSSDEDGDSLNYQWTLVESPNNTMSYLTGESTVNPTFIADTPGVYVVALIVNDSKLDSLPDYASIEISEPGSPPKADAGPDSNGTTNTPLLLDGTASYATQEGRTLTYSWQAVDIPPGSSPAFSNPEAVQPQFVADTAGIYKLALIVNDGIESSVADETVVTVSDKRVNTKPIAQASFRVGYNEMEAKTIYLNAGDSSDANGDTLRYRWMISNHHPDYPDRPELDVVAPQWISEPSDQRVKLIVNDGEVDSDPIEFVIPADTSFTPSIDFDTTTITREVGTKVLLSAFIQDHDTSAPPEPKWALLEQPASSVTEVDDPTAADTTLLLDRAGKYIVQISVDDGTPNGQISSQKTIFAGTTSNQRPFAHAGIDRTLELGSTPQRILLDGSASYDPEGDQLGFHWQLSTPLGSQARLNDPTMPQPSFSPDKPGEYLLSLRVDDGQALSDDHEITINAERTGSNNTPIASTGPDISAEVHTEIRLDGTASNDLDGDAIAFFWRVVSKPQGSRATFSSDQSSRPMPAFTADVPGTYQINLTVNDFEAVSAPDTMTIQVSEKNTAPVANTGQKPGEYETLITGQSVTVDASHSYDPEGEDLSYNWSILKKPVNSIADLTTTDKPIITFAPDIQGHYQLGLKVNDSKTDSAFDYFSIRAYDADNRPPVAIVGEPVTDFVNTIIYLDGSQAYDPDGDTLVSRRWQVIVGPSGANIRLVAPWDESPWFTGDKPGTYMIGYAVNDGQLPSETVYQKVTLIGPTPPIANAGNDLSSRVTHPVQLEGRNSIDPDGDNLSFQWQIQKQPPGSSAYLQDMNTSQAKLVADTIGEYTIQLTVSDGYTTSSDIVVVSLFHNRAPIAVAGPDRLVLVNELVELDGATSSDPDGDNIAYKWSIISKPAGSWSNLSASFVESPDFVPDLPGNYTFQLVVNDGDLDSPSNRVTVTAERANAIPIADAGNQQTITTGRSVRLDGSLSNDPDNDPLSYSWSLLSVPFGSTSTLVNAESADPRLTPDTEGDYLIQLIVNDGEFDSSPATVLITAVSNNSVPEAYASYSHSVITGDKVSVSGWASDDPDGDALEYLWSIVSKPAGSKTILSNKELMAPEFVADKTGTYILELTVSDGLAQSQPHSITISATKGSVDLPPDPGHAGRQTLLGIDSDTDGVRDDIQRHIWATYPEDENDNIRKALTEIAKHYEVILWEAMDPNNAYSNAIELSLHLECLAYIVKDGSHKLSGRLRAEFLNTEDRSDVYLLYDKALEGSIFPSTPYDQWKNSCAFNVD